MPYDPQWPQDGQLIDATLFRHQFSGLKDLIDASPAGPPGQNGNDGTSVTGAIIDGTNTLNPGDAAQASVSWDGANVRFTFGLPRGQDGASPTPITSFIVDGVNTLNPGEPATAETTFDGSSVRILFGIPRGNDGTNGSDGTNGTSVGGAIVDAVSTLEPEEPATAAASWDGSNVHFSFALPRGNDGLPFGQTVVDAVDTLEPTEPATVQTSFDGSSVHFTFGIPRGNDGDPGPPGGVTTEQLEAAIATALDGTSSNSNGVATLDTPFANDPPTLADLELMRVKMNELIDALRR